MCKNCKTKENIVHSGTDAFMLECLEDFHNICYSCANKND
jgi:hypothetical protein